MNYHIGRVNIVKNEGSIIFGNVKNVSPSDTSNNNQGAGDTGEVIFDSNGFSVTIPVDPNDPNAIRKKK